jgi:hypothetical protein
MLSELKKFSRPITVGLICFLGFILVGWILPPIFWPGGIGIGKDDSVTTTTVETIEKDKQGKTVKKVTTTAHNDGKTLWDWGSLLGVPLSLAILGYVLQEQQRKRADNETKEEVLQTYLDRLSVLLIDKNLIALSNKSNSFTITPIALSNKSHSPKITPEEQELLDSSLDVIRARTLSILRRFANDAERKTSVIKFLIETEIVGKSKLNLSWANLSWATLSGANLQGANLRGTNLEGADLFWADLSWSDLSLSNLEGADLFWANLQGVDLFRANLEGVDLEGANLEGANLKSANLSGAKLIEAKLIESNLYEANLENIQWNSKTIWPDKSAFANAKNIPEELKKELGITP